MRLTEFIIIFSVILVLVSSAGLHEEFTWSKITYRWPSSGRLKRNFGVESSNRFTGRYKSHYENPDGIVFEGETNAATAGGNRPQQQNVPSYIDYRYENNIPIGVNVWRNKLFVTVARRQPGIPSTLNYVPLDSRVKHNVPLIPYPNWKKNLYLPSESNPDEVFISIYRIAIDPCDRLWVVDTGILEMPGNFTRVKPTTIIAIDLHTDTIIHKHQIPKSRLRPQPGQISVTVDVTKDTCDDAYVYIPDLSAYELTVYSLKQDKSWVVNHDYFSAVREEAQLFVGGFNFSWYDGVFSVELTELKPNGFRDMYFHAMASTNMYKVSTRILRNESLATRANHGKDFKVVGYKGEKSQTSAADIHKASGRMFLSLVNQNALGCWHIRCPLDTLSTVQRDDRRMIYPSDVKVSNNKVYLLTNSMPVFVYGTLNYDEINFRVWSNTVEAAVQGTNCA